MSQFWCLVSFFESTICSRFVLTGLESLQICIKLLFCVQSCMYWVAYWVRVILASIFSNNRFENICGLADVGLVNNHFTCKHYWLTSNHIFSNFRKLMFISFYGWIKFSTGRIVQTNVGQVFFQPPHFLQNGIVLGSSRLFFGESHSQQRKFCFQSTTDQLFVVYILFSRGLQFCSLLWKASYGRSSLSFRLSWCWTIRMEKFFLSLMSCKLSGMIQDW